jgi:hypothetical protein
VLNSNAQVAAAPTTNEQASQAAKTFEATPQEYKAPAPAVKEKPLTK